jgi:hypothetical protein
MGTAVNVQAMVFGNMGETSATGVAFTRSPSTGENYFYGEYLVNAQGEDVVAGIRTPSPINEQSKSEKNQHHTSLEKGMPKLYAELFAIRSAWSATIGTCWISSSRSRKAACGCSSAAWASAMARRPCAWPWICSRRK